MAASRHADKLCAAAIVLALIITALLMIFSLSDEESGGSSKKYEQTLFDISVVHSIDILADNWDEFIASCEDEQYIACDVVIDGTTYRNVGIRAKGNTSLSNVSALGSSRYSFKIEFDHYEDGLSCDGLDKLSLNNIIQDNTYMKDFLCYRMMYEAGADAPLCSYSYISVNGEDWGLYLAVEGVEESFLERNYGADYGELYKPDSNDMGGGRGNGRGFELDSTLGSEDAEAPDSSEMPEPAQGGFNGPHDSGNAPDQPQGGFGGQRGDENGMQQMPMGEGARPDMPSGGMPDGEIPEMPDGKMPAMQENTAPQFSDSRGSDDVLLRYSDDDPDSYPNIFENAKTPIGSADKARLMQALKTLNSGEDIASCVDIDEVLRYFAVHNFVCNFDSYTGSMIHNYYLYEKDGILSMIPWDYNLAFGGFESGTDADTLVNYPIDDPVSGTSAQERPMLAWIFGSDKYTELYHEYMEQFISLMFSSGRFDELFGSTYALIAPYVEKDPSKFCTYEEFEEGAETLRKFCLLRAESISAQLDGSIPSTSAGQQEDKSSFIDASDLRIDSMGGMDNTIMGGGGMDFSQQGGKEAPERVQSSPIGQAALPIIVSAAVLVGAIIFAAAYKRRR